MGSFCIIMIEYCSSLETGGIPIFYLGEAGAGKGAADVSGVGIDDEWRLCRRQDSPSKRILFGVPQVAAAEEEESAAEKKKKKKKKMMMKRTPIATTYVQRAYGSKPLSWISSRQFDNLRLRMGLAALRYNCHYDGLDNFIIQVAGKKTFVILHPNEAIYLYPKKEYDLFAK
eukprot:jgi/Bigna1/147375/aug1.144_g22083